MGRKAIGWIATLAILAALAGGAAFVLTGAEPTGEREVMSAGGRAETPVAPAAAADAKTSVAAPPAATSNAAATLTTPATPEPTPEATPEPTPEATPEPTPEATPEATPEPTPEATPGNNAAAIAAMRETVRGLRPPTHRPTAADMYDLVDISTDHLLPRPGEWQPRWMRDGRFRTASEVPDIEWWEDGWWAEDELLLVDCD